MPTEEHSLRMSGSMSREKQHNELMRTGVAFFFSFSFSASLRIRLIPTLFRLVPAPFHFCLFQLVLL